MYVGSQFYEECVEYGVNYEVFGLFHEETDVCVAMGVVYCMKW